MAVLMLLLLVFYKAYTSALQRLFLHLTIVTTISEVILVLETEHLFEYKGQERFCQVLGFFVTWTSTMVYLFTFGIVFFLLYMVYKQLKGDPFSRLSHSKCLRVSLECFYVSAMIFFPLIYLWVPFVHGNYGLSGAWCWMRGIDEHCKSVGFEDQMLFFYSIDALVSTVSVLSTLVLLVVFCRLAWTYREIRQQHMKTVRLTLLLMGFLLASVVFDSMGLVVRLYTGLTGTHQVYTLWLMYAIGPPIAELIFPIGFMVYLYSLKKFQLDAIKRAIVDWKACHSCSKCCKRRSKSYIQSSVDSSSNEDATAPGSHRISVPSTSYFHVPHTGGFTSISEESHDQNLPTQPLLSHGGSGYGSTGGAIDH